jgi:cytochrome P450 / NADPH-cytochrome P450 reductase
MSPYVSIDELPGPHGVPVLGNLFDIDTSSPIDTFIGLAREFGPIYKLTLPAGSRVMVSGVDIVDQMSDDAAWDKNIGPGLKIIQQSVAGAGLFSSYTDDPMWHRAHNILMAPFSQQAMREYMPRMLDIAGQLMDKWARLNPEEEVNVPQDMTALTVDTIALCGFDYRLNSFYRDTPHPFVQAMTRVLVEAQKRATLPPVARRLRVRANRHSEEDQEYMKTFVEGLMRDRRARGSAADNTDLLGRMLTGIDKQSGLGLPDDNVVAQCLTFLVAGHETTSGLLSFAIYYLMKNPDVLAKAEAEVDEVLGDDAMPTYEQVRNLTYIRQILDETLRLWPTAPMFVRAPYEDTVLVDKYEIPAGTPVSIVTPMLHRDRGVWGEDAEEFNPEHFTAERKAELPPNAYKPFGTGMRACIGRQFALQEATLVLGMLVQRFEFVDFSDYQLQTLASLTVKPKDLFIQVKPRPGRLEALRPRAREESAETQEEPSALGPSAHGTPLLVLFGSNLGTAEGIANKLGGEAAARGFDAQVAPLDDYSATLPTEGAVLIVCASYNGMPPENAVGFVDWLKSDRVDANALAGVSFSVFGCGDTDWAATYQAVPTLIDEQLAAHGATRLHPRGAGDAHADFDGQYRSWHADLWSDLADGLDIDTDQTGPASAAPSLAITLVNRQLTNPVLMSYEALGAKVAENRELSAIGEMVPGVRSTRHIEIDLPDDIDYRAGDHLGVLPRNSIELIRRVMFRFGLDAGMYATVSTSGPGTFTHLPLDEPAPLLGILGSSVELQARATRADIEALAGYTEDPTERAELEGLIGDDEASQDRYRDQIVGPNVSVLDLLERYPSCAIPFEAYLALLPPLQPRYYSISSSAMVSPRQASITVGVLSGPSTRPDHTYAGVCSNYLAAMPDNATVFVFKREPTIPFRPTADPSVPMIMVGAGTGLAPFRGFLQERAAQGAAGAELAPSLLFFGCRIPGHDDLYRDEMAEFTQTANTSVYTVFSEAPVDGRRYAQHEMLARADEVGHLIDAGAVIFVCGNARTLAPGVRAALTQIHASRTGCSADDAQSWLAQLRTENRFLEDIWGGR